MPSEPLPPHSQSITRQGPPETLQHPPSRGGVRMLLGLPFSGSGALSMVASTVPAGRNRYGQSPLPAPEESTESFAETPAGEEVIDETDTPRNFPRTPLRDGAPFSRAMRENAADARSTLTEPSVEDREQIRLVIPGVSTHRTAFPTLSQTVDIQRNSVEGEQRDTIPPQAARLNAPVSMTRAREMTGSDVELLTRLEQLVTQGVKAQKSSEARSRSSATLSPGPLEPMSMQNGQRGGQDLAQRFEQLQRTVRDLAATVSSQRARNRNESQAQRSEPKTPPLQRTVIIKHSEASSTAPRAFWERSRLGRFCLKTRR